MSKSATIVVAVIIFSQIAAPLVGTSTSCIVNIDGDANGQGRCGVNINGTFYGKGANNPYQNGFRDDQIRDDLAALICASGYFGVIYVGDTTFIVIKRNVSITDCSPDCTNSHTQIDTALPNTSIVVVDFDVKDNIQNVSDAETALGEPKAGGN